MINTTVAYSVERDLRVSYLMKSAFELTFTNHTSGLRPASGLGHDSRVGMRSAFMAIVFINF